MGATVFVFALLGLLLPAVGSPVVDSNEAAGAKQPVTIPYSKTAASRTYHWVLPVEPPEENRRAARPSTGAAAD